MTIGIGQKRVRPFNDIVLLVFERPQSCHWRSKFLVVSKSSEFNLKDSSGIIFSFCYIKIVWLDWIVRH